MDKIHFLGNRQRFFTRIYSGRIFQESLKILPKLFKELQLLQCFISYFKITPKKYLEISSHLLCSLFNVVKQFISKHVLNVHPSFHTSSKSFCEADFITDNNLAYVKPAVIRGNHTMYAVKTLYT